MINEALLDRWLRTTGHVVSPFVTYSANYYFNNLVNSITRFSTAEDYETLVLLWLIRTIDSRP